MFRYSLVSVIYFHSSDPTCLSVHSRSRVISRSNRAELAAPVPNEDGFFSQMPPPATAVKDDDTDADAGAADEADADAASERGVRMPASRKRLAAAASAGKHCANATRNASGARPVTARAWHSSPSIAPLSVPCAAA